MKPPATSGSTTTLASANLRERVIRDINASGLGTKKNSGPKRAGSAAFTFDGRLVPAVALSPNRLPRHLYAGAKTLLRQTQSIGRDCYCIRLAVNENLSSDRSFELRGHDFDIPAASEPVRTKLCRIRRPGPPGRNRRTTLAAVAERLRSVPHQPFLAFHGPVAERAADVRDSAASAATAPSNAGATTATTGRPRHAPPR